MRIKRLELYGYKSFATRCIFEFGDGITAIVGPNGSGKSNVADAVRWVMGEQRYSSLRAKSSTDMIFSGSRARARLGIAEVLITLDNADGSLPIDYEEVTVGRRAFRSGDSEYLINGTKVRRRDIIEMLGGAGLGRSSYTVIGQGLVDQALALTPEARRSLFEEAAGISPHLRKREEALRRVQETERNLERVQDILGELAPQARRLRRQADRAQEHALLSRDLVELQRIWYGHQWHRTQQGMIASDHELAQARAHVQSQRDYAKGFGGRIQALETSIQERQDEIAAIEAERQRLLNQAQEQRRRMAVVDERQRLYQQQQRTLANETQALTSRQEILRGEVTTATAELAEQEQLLSVAQGELRQAQAEQSISHRARQALRDKAQAAQKELNRLVQQQSRLQARREQNAHQRESLERDKQSAAKQLQTIASRMRELSDRQTRLSSEQAEMERAVKRASAERNTLVAELAEIDQELATSAKSLGALRNDQERLVSRHDMLTRVRQELTGYVPGVRAVLGARRRLDGILGTVANLMQVPEAYEAAIESALGGRLQNLVTETWEDAENAINHLKSNRAGWATFLPLDTVRSRSTLRPPADSDVVGVGIELIDFDSRLRPVFEMLLGRILVVKDLTAARRLLRARTGASLLVTLGGETVQPSGALSGGNRNRRTNLLEQEREWRQLPNQIAEVTTRIQQAEEKAAQSQARRQALADKSQALGTSIADTEHQLRQSARTMDKTANDLAQQERERDWLSGQTERFERDLAAVETDDTQLTQELATSQESEITLSAELSQLQEQLEASNDATLAQRVAEIETRTAVAQRTVQSQRRLISSHKGNLDQLASQLADKTSQAEQLAADLVALEQAKEDDVQEQAGLAGALEKLEQQAMPVHKALEELTLSRRETEQQQLESTERLHEAEIALSRAAMARERAQDQQDSMAQEIAAELGPIDLPDTVSHQLRLTLGEDTVTLPAVESLPRGLGEDIRQLKARVRRLGHINLDAPEEYQEILERQTFMESQVADLRGAIASLHEVVQELDLVIERDFRDTVGRVDGAFQAYFRRLFDGGSAHIVLTDPNNLSETGVDIVAHPPGKRAQTLSLLSGGERALTAVALIFALLVANPVPFCFLDEVDAALDEANVGRFRDLLKEQSEEIQFAVITHNRRTIEAASTIFGVSMGEVGVSQSVSLKLENVGTYTAQGVSAASM